MNSEKATVLFVDDEERILHSMNMLFRRQYNVLTCSAASEAIEIVKHQTVHTVVSDQRMPNMTGVEFLAQVKEVSPCTMRILLTGYSDLDAITDAVNQGEIYRYLTKPWQINEFKQTIAEAVEIACGLFDHGAVGQTPVLLQNSGVLVIDSDVETFNRVRDAVVGMPVHWGVDLDRAFEILDREEIGIVVSELKIHGLDCTAALQQLKIHHPEIVTLVTSAMDNASGIIGLINEAQVFRFHSKPLKAGLLKRNIDSAIKYHHKLIARPNERKRHRVSGNLKALNFSQTVLDYFKKNSDKAA